MQIRSQNTPYPLCDELESALQDIRAKRNFQPSIMREAKAVLLNQYIGESRLSSCVVAVSGGIDSAVVLGLVHFASQLPNSPIKRIVPVLLPVSNTPGATNQDTATLRGREVCRHFHMNPLELDLGALHKSATQLADLAFAQENLVQAGNPWAVGQLVSTLRTPMLYYITSLLVQAGQSGLLVGTTNRDEGGYLGYFGKASDGMVDLQLISDLHKSEIYQLGALMQIPSSVMNVAPTGDMFDGGIDENVFGAPYDFVELLLALKVNHEIMKTPIINPEWSQETKQEFTRYQDSLEAMHGYNAHKYVGRSPAVHLDIMEAWVLGGWDNRSQTHYTTPLHAGAVGLFQSDVEVHPMAPLVTQHIVQDRKVIVMDNLIPADEVTRLVHELDSREDWVPSGRDGRALNGREINNWRKSSFCPTSADRIWQVIKPYVDILVLNGKEAEKNGWKLWRPVGVNPLFRFIKYKNHGSLILHYDAPYVIDDHHRTMMTLVVYLEGNEDEGHLRFIEDNDPQYPDREIEETDKILLQLAPLPSRAVMFPHCLAHDGAMVEERKILFRTDIVFEKVDWRRG